MCLFLLFVTLFPQVFAQWIRHLWGRPGRKDRTVCGVRADGGWLVFSAVMSVQMTRAVLRHPAQPETVVVLGCKVRGTRPSRMLLRRLEAAQKYLEENPEVSCITTGGQGAGEDIPEGQGDENLAGGTTALPKAASRQRLPQRTPRRIWNTPPPFCRSRDWTTALSS